VWKLAVLGIVLTMCGVAMILGSFLGEQSILLSWRVEYESRYGSPPFGQATSPCWESGTPNSSYDSAWCSRLRFAQSFWDPGWIILSVGVVIALSGTVMAIVPRGGKPSATGPEQQQTTPRPEERPTPLSLTSVLGTPVFHVCTG